MSKKSITVLSAQELLTKKSASFIKRTLDDSEIDYSDIPELTDEQLRKFKRRGRPVIGESPRVAISIRVETKTLERLKKKAKTMRVGYQSLINQILKKAI